MDCSLTVMRYLDRVQGLYPYGIPHSILVQASSSPAPQIPLQSGLIFVVALNGELSLDVRELLDSIISKGLLLTPEQVKVVTLDSEIITKDRIRADIEELQATGVGVPFVILFGAGLEQPGTLTTLSNTTTLSTRTLSEVLVSREVKREVWQHLQKIKPLTEVFSISSSQIKEG